MKNYEVEAIMRFTDKEEGLTREPKDVFLCTKERFNVLKSKNAVKLIEIKEEKTEVIINQEKTFDFEVKKEDLEIKPKKKKNTKKSK